MPQDRQAVLHFVVILLLVPVQYLIVTYFGSTTTQKSQQLQQLISLASKYKDQYLSWETWQKWCYDVLKRISSLNSIKSRRMARETEDDGESLAIEVLRYRNPKGYFGMSVEPRTPRPQFVKYRIGQVVLHKRYNYRGVIVGWDSTGKAPEDWLEKSLESNKQQWKNQPNYSILVDTRDRSRAQMAYVAEEFLEPIPEFKVIHPDLEKYFEGHDGSRYRPRPRLKVLYPHD